MFDLPCLGEKIDKLQFSEGYLPNQSKLQKNFSMQCNIVKTEIAKYSLWLESTLIYCHPIQIVGLVLIKSSNNIRRSLNYGD